MREVGGGCFCLAGRKGGGHPPEGINKHHHPGKAEAAAAAESAQVKTLADAKAATEKAQKEAEALREQVRAANSTTAVATGGHWFPITLTAMVAVHLIHLVREHRGDESHDSMV